MRTLVIGAGITGLSIAEHLRREGLKVILIDRVSPSDPEQASFGNAGILARSAIVPVSQPGLIRKIPQMLINPSNPLFVRWAYLPKLAPWLIPFLRSGSGERLDEIISALDSLTSDAVDQHLKLTAGTDARKFIRLGEIGYIYPDEEAFLDDSFMRETKSRYGYECRKLTRSQIEDLDPFISKKYNVAAVYNNHGWITSPSKYVRAIFDSYTSLGGEYIQDEVIEILEKEVVLKNAKNLSVDKVILAMGAWSGSLAKKLGVRAKVQSERGYHIFFKGSNRCPPFPIMLSDGKFFVTPMEGGIRCAGVVEFGSLTAPPSRKPIELIRSRVREFYNDLDFEEESVWMGHRPSTPDSLPLIGTLKDKPNVIFAFGSQHIGLTIGPKIGYLVSQLMMNKKINCSMAPFDSNRFN